MSTIKGRIWKYGDSVSTDVIFPGKYTYTVSDPEQMAQYALEDLDPRFAKGVRTGDIIVGGANWGCGSSREQAVVCIKQSGVGAIVAKSFARIYYRNCLNSALPAIVCPQAVDAVLHGEEMTIDISAGVIKTKGSEFSFPPLPQAVMGIFSAGGLLPYTRRILQEREAKSLKTRT